jgi:hypothetical protein
MGISETISDILTRLATVSVTTPDGNTATMYARVFNNQIERKKDGTGYVYQTPACFVETQLSEGEPIGQGVTSYDVRFRILVEIENLNTEGDQDEALQIFAVKDLVHRKMNGYKPANCSPLYRSSEEFDHNHDNVYLCVMEYSGTFIDVTGSMYDTATGDYTEDTLVDPLLRIEETIYQGVLPDEFVSETFTATDGQTVFTITGGYTVGNVDVYVNTIKLNESQFTAADGIRVTLIVPSTGGDIVLIIKY